LLTFLLTDATHLLTSSALGDVTGGINTGCCRRPPPPYQLRPRRQNHINDTEIHNPDNGSLVRGLHGIDSTRNQNGEPTNGPEATVVRAISNKDRISLNPRRSSVQSPLKRRDSARKENLYSPLSTCQSAAGKNGAAPAKRSPEVGSGKNCCSPRNAVVLKRLSLTVKDRNWHRELVEQYNGGRRTSASSNVVAR